MDLKQFRDDPKFIQYLVSYRIRRNLTLGIDPLIGFNKDIFDFLQNQVGNLEFYLELLKYNQLELITKTLIVQEKIKQLKESKESLNVKKSRLLDIMVLMQEVEDLANNIMIE